MSWKILFHIKKLFIKISALKGLRVPQVRLIRRDYARGGHFIFPVYSFSCLIQPIKYQVYILRLCI